MKGGEEGAALDQPGHGRMCGENKCPRISMAVGNKGLPKMREGSTWEARSEEHP